MGMLHGHRRHGAVHKPILHGIGPGPKAEDRRRKVGEDPRAHTTDSTSTMAKDKQHNPR